MAWYKAHQFIECFGPGVRGCTGRTVSSTDYRINSGTRNSPLIPFDATHWFTRRRTGVLVRAPASVSSGHRNVPKYRHHAKQVTFSGESQSVGADRAPYRRSGGERRAARSVRARRPRVRHERDEYTAPRPVRAVTMIHAVFILVSGAVCAHCVEVPTLKLNDGRDIPALALGTWLGNDTKGRIGPGATDVEDAVSWAIEAGYRHIDTASVYRTEDQVGRAIAKKVQEGLKRENLFVTTKLWNDAHARRAVAPALRRSLAALGLQRVDLYLIHWPVGQFSNNSYDHTDYVETWRGMMEAKGLGLTRSIGLSNFNQEQIDRLLDEGLERPAVLQVEINLNLQQPELLAYCRRQNITVMGYTPFGSLFYQKAKPDAPPPRIDDPKLLEIANKHNKTVPQITLRYLIELGVIPIPKSLTRSRIYENVDVFDFELTADERETLRSFDRGYRTIPQVKWRDHPYYPFEKN